MKDKFRAVMKDALKSILGYVPDIYDEGPVFSAARGAAEFARRGGFSVEPKKDLGMEPETRT
jgi:hypothetical protein